MQIRVHEHSYRYQYMYSMYRHEQRWTDKKETWYRGFGNKSKSAYVELNMGVNMIIHRVKNPVQCQLFVASCPSLPSAVILWSVGRKCPEQGDEVAPSSAGGSGFVSRNTNALLLHVHTSLFYLSNTAPPAGQRRETLLRKTEMCPAVNIMWCTLAQKNFVKDAIVKRWILFFLASQPSRNDSFHYLSLIDSVR